MAISSANFSVSSQSTPVDVERTGNDEASNAPSNSKGHRNRRGSCSETVTGLTQVESQKNDMNENVSTSSLRLYADDTTQHRAEKNPVVLQYILNQDIERLSTWLKDTYLQANGDKTQR